MLGVHADISKEQLALLLPVGVACALVGYGVKTYLDKKPGLCNPSIKKDEAKVVHTMDIEDLSEKTVFCRCWRSEKFPYCDGSHNKYNETCGDNVGPLILKKNELK